MRSLRRSADALTPDGRFVLVEYDAEHGNPYVPYPISFKRWQRVAVAAGFASPACCTASQAASWARSTEPSAHVAPESDAPAYDQGERMRLPAGLSCEQAASAALPPINPAAARKLRRGTRVRAILAIRASRLSFATCSLLHEDQGRAQAHLSRRLERDGV